MEFHDQLLSPEASSSALLSISSLRQGRNLFGADIEWFLKNFRL
ncbi:hypothetical protein STRDD11_00365 [Streptococcus sp. DD11]|nr:hypothetical protein STRDD11_00365 [Streptococcus sp. DD11]